MLRHLIEFKPGETVTLIPNSGIQFLDFGFRRDQVARLSRAFAAVVRADGATADIYPLYPDPDGGENRVYFPPGGDAAGVVADEDQIYSLKAEAALLSLDRTWLPFPFFRRTTSGFDDGPTTWARAKVIALETPDSYGNTHRVVIAFDTLLTPRLPGQPYAAPEENGDATGKIYFGFSPDHRRNGFFMKLPWVADWLKDRYATGLSRRRGRNVSPDEFANPGEHWAAYMMLIDVIAATCPVPAVELADLFSDYGRATPVKVSLVLDIGNSRMCGVLVEEARTEAFADVSQTYRLELRDLGQVEHGYSEPFESRLEFAAADFGPQRFAARASRNKRDAFWWPSSVRIGPEAARLSALTDGTEGASGLSSPKRYLWDGAARPVPWVNNDYGRAPGEDPQEIRGPIVSRLTEDGTPIRRRRGAVPGLLRRYSRSSMYTLMLAELLIHAASQINSVDVRRARLEASLPRVLGQIIVTLPTATPLAEQRIMRRRIEDAVNLVWEVMGWEGSATFPKPSTRLDWDEATCAHLVYLFNEIQHKFHGSPRDYFALAGEGRTAASGSPAMRIASVDIGGGTTDLMIMQHEIQPDTQTVIEPRQLFREGFRLAGDDVLKVLVEDSLFPQIEAHLAACGVSRPAGLMADMFGGDRDGMSQNERSLRGRLVSAVFARAAIGLMKTYEADCREAGPGKRTLPFGDLLSDSAAPGEPAIRHFEALVARAGGREFRLAEVPVTVDTSEIARIVEALVGPMINDLCDLVRAHDCDVLLITGRPSMFPAVQDLFFSAMPVPVNRIIVMGAYRVGNWYPFRSDDFLIRDPKTTAVVGAMLCHTCSRAVGNFTLRTQGMTMKSTARYIGAMSLSGQITRVLLENVDLDSGAGVTEFVLPMDSPVFIGFRQLPLERWIASPLYSVRFRDPDQVARLQLPLRVTFERMDGAGDDEAAMEDFRIVSVEDADDMPKEGVVTCSLQTMLVETQSDAGYWLDTGVMRVAG